MLLVTSLLQKILWVCFLPFGEDGNRCRHKSCLFLALDYNRREGSFTMCDECLKQFKDLGCYDTSKEGIFVAREELRKSDIHNLWGVPVIIHIEIILMRELHMKNCFVSFLFTQYGCMEEQKPCNFHEIKKIKAFFICLNTVLYLSFAMSCSDPEKVFS